MKAKFGDKHSIQNGERVVMGYYKHNGPSPIVNTRRDFESANYSETTEVPVGVYPIYAGWNHYGRNGGQGTLYVEFKGVVTKDYFPSSLAGVVYTQPESKHKGEERIVTNTLEVVSAIEKTGNTPNKSYKEGEEIKPDIYINPKYYPDILEFYQNQLKEDTAYMQTVIADKDKPLLEKANTLKYAAGCISYTASAVETISKSIEYQKTPGFASHTKSNTHWVPKSKSPSKEKEESLPDMN